MIGNTKLLNLNSRKIGFAISLSLLIPPNIGINFYGVNLEDLPLIFLLIFLLINKSKKLLITKFDTYSIFFISFFIVYSNLFTQNFKLFNQTNLRFYFYFVIAYLSIDIIINTNSKLLDLFEPLRIVMLGNFLVIILQIQLPGTIDGWILSGYKFSFLPPGRLGGLQGGGPNVIGIICALYLLICLNKIISSKNKINYLFDDKVNSFFLFISFINLLLTYSRGSYLAFFIGLVVIIFFEKSITRKSKVLFLTSIVSITVLLIFIAPTIFLKQSNRLYLSSMAINNTNIFTGVGGGFYVKEVYKDYLITLDDQTLLETFNISYDEESDENQKYDLPENDNEYIEAFLKLNFVHRTGFFPRSEIRFYFSNDGKQWTQIGSRFTTGTVINLIENNSYFEVGGWADGQSPDNSYLDGFINEVQITTSTHKYKYEFNEENRDQSFYVFLPNSKDFYDNRNDGKLIFNDKGLKLIRPRSYWVAIPNINSLSNKDFEIVLNLYLNNIPRGNETIFSQSSILSQNGQINNQSWKWSIVNGKMYFFWIEDVNEGYSNYLGGQSLRSEKLIINKGYLSKTQSDFTISQYDEITTSHNGFLTMAVEYGAAIVLIILLSLVYLIFKNFNSKNKIELGLISIFIVQNLTNDLIYAPDTAILFWMIPFYFLGKLVKNR